jgi:sugar phosphate permease
VGVVRMGSVLCAAGLAAIAVGMLQRSYAIIACGMMLHGAGMAFLMNPIQTDVVSRVPPVQRGESAGLAATARQVGNALGVAIAATLLARTGLDSLDAGTMAQAEAETVARSFAWMGAMQVMAMLAAVVTAWSLVRDRVPHRTSRG